MLLMKYTIYTHKSGTQLPKERLRSPCLPVVLFNFFPSFFKDINGHSVFSGLLLLSLKHILFRSLNRTLINACERYEKSTKNNVLCF
jgi:hypothetical protein